MIDPAIISYQSSIEHHRYSFMDYRFPMISCKSNQEMISLLLFPNQFFPFVSFVIFTLVIHNFVWKWLPPPLQNTRCEVSKQNVWQLLAWDGLKSCFQNQTPWCLRQIPSSQFHWQKPRMIQLIIHVWDVELDLNTYKPSIDLCTWSAATATCKILMNLHVKRAWLIWREYKWLTSRFV